MWQKPKYCVFIWKLFQPVIDDDNVNSVSIMCIDCSRKRVQQLTVSPPQSHLGRAALSPLTAENGLARCVRQMCNAHCRRIQSLSRQYAVIEAVVDGQTDVKTRCSEGQTQQEGESALIHDLLFLAISAIESAVGKRLITHCCVSRVARSRLSGLIEPHSPRLQA